MIPIGKEELALLKQRADLVDLIRAHGYTLEKKGKTFVGRCPSADHPDENPSFHVYPESKTYKCFGCGKRGDPITFLREFVGLGWPEALDELKLRYGAGLVRGNGSKGSAQAVCSPKSPGSERGKPDREAASPGESTPVGPSEPSPPPAPPCDIPEPERAQLLDAYVTHCEGALSRSTAAQRYLASRALFVPEVLKPLRIGYADGSVVKAIAPDGEKRSKLTQLGVLLPDGSEAMTGMIVVPLLDLKSGAVLNLYGRSVRYRRHHYLPGELRGLVNGAVASGCEDLVLVESVLDAVSLLVLGIQNVLPLYGTNGWKAGHDQVLDEGVVKTVTLLLDADEAGKRASEVLGRKLAARGLRVRVASLNGHKDPNDALKDGMTAEAMREVLARAATVHEPAVATARAEASPVPPASPATAKYDVEDLSDGFQLTAGSRRYSVRGIKGSPGERLEMTLRLEDGWSSYVDRIDLVNARSRRSFARQAARRFHLAEDLLERDLGDFLYSEAEAWLATRAKAEDGEPDRPRAPELTEEQKGKALALLRDPNLLDLTVQHLTRLGYVGEETNKVLGYLIIVSRRLEDPLSAVILSQSAAGKSGLTSLLEKVTPPEDVKFFSRLTPAALYYMEQDELVRKVVIIEERSGSDGADYSIRTLQSRKKLVIVFPRTDPRTGRTKTQSKVVDGPAVFIETTTALEVNVENLTRCYELYLDESEEQTRRIHEYQRRLKTREGMREAEEAQGLLELHWNAQRILKPAKVVIPWSELLTFPTALRTRRDHERFLNLIKASAFYHQYQRPTPKQGEIEAVEDDYAVAYNLSAHVLGGSLSDVKKPARDLLAAMRELCAKLARERNLPAERVALTRREVRETTGLPDLQVWRLLQALLSLEHVEVVSGSNGRRCYYRPVVAAGERGRVVQGLLTPEELHQKLKKWRPEGADGGES